MKDVKLGDLFLKGCELKVLTVTFYDKEGHKLLEINCDEEENNKIKITQKGGINNGRNNEAN